MKFKPLVAVFGSLKRPGRVSPPNWTPRAFDADAADMVDEVETDADDTIDGLTFGLRYRDAKGAVTDRVVECYRLKLTDAGDLLLYAYCHVRDANRCFRIDRIEQLTDYRTGEVHDDYVPIFTSFCRAAGIAWQGSATQTSHEKLLQRSRDGLKVLIYIAGCDGELHPEELEQIFIYADEMALFDDGRMLVYSEDDLMAWIQRQWPSARSVERAIDRIADQSERDRATFKRALRSVIEADEVIDDNEAVAFEEILKLLQD